MDQREQLSALIGRIYDAALDSTLWTDVLTEITEFVGGQTAGLSSSPLSRVGIDSRSVQSYLEAYAHADLPSTPLLFDVEAIVNKTALVPDEELLLRDLSQGAAEPHGFVDASNALLEKSATCRADFNVRRNRTQGMDAEMRRRLNLIAPHMRRAVLIGRVIGLRQAEAAAFIDVTDRLGGGIFLLDADVRIVHANAAGHRLLDAGDLLRRIGGRLVMADAPTDRFLREMSAAAGNADDAFGVEGTAVPLVGSCGERYVGRVLPLTGYRRYSRVKCDAVVALLVRKATFGMPVQPAVIARAYKLTPTELRVLLAIVEVGGVPEVATILGIAETTVKTHLGRLFNKTGARRQADLVKLVAGFSSPLAN
jgi:DNA-binding CsgD family transcriptional regulator/PAS domain-containing protein